MTRFNKHGNEHRNKTPRAARSAALATTLAAGLVLSTATPVAHAEPSKKTEASGSANVASPKVKYPGAGTSATRKITKPNSRSKIFWSWQLRADTRGHDGTTSEKKFDFPGGGVINERDEFRGPHLRRDVNNVAIADNKITLTGNRGSTAWGKGTGSSSITTVGGRTNYSVSWEVDAKGTLGTPPPAVKWSSRMNGKDPFYISASDLDEMGFLDKPMLDLFFPVGISNVAVTGEDSGYSFNVEFGINGETHSLFSLSADEHGASISGPSTGYGVSIYSLSTLHDDPAFGAPTISIEDLGSMLAADMSDGFLDSEALFAFEVHDVAVADIIAADTYFSAASEAWAGEAADAPAPGPFALLGLAGLASARRRR